MKLNDETRRNGGRPKGRPRKQVEGQLRLFSRKGDGWRIHNEKPGRRDATIPMERLVAAREKSGVTVAELSRRVYGNTKTLNGSRIKKTKNVTPATALRWIRALDLDPIDFGL